MKHILAAALSSLALLTACGDEQTTESSDLKESTSLTQDAALAKPQALLVDLNVNRAYYFENGQKVESWNIVSGRDYNGANGYQGTVADYTPMGVYYIHQIEKCPLYYPRSGAVKGACASDNPLGSRGLWFKSGRLYGLHGTTAPALMSHADNSRRYSGGCVRNKNAQIEKIFDKIQGNYSYSTGSGAYKVYRAKSGQAVPVVVGKFSGAYDSGANVPSVPSVSGEAKRQAIGKVCTSVAQPAGSKVWIRSFAVADGLLSGQPEVVAKLDDGTKLAIRGFLKDEDGVTYASIDSIDGSLRAEFGAVFAKVDQFAQFSQCEAQ